MTIILDIFVREVLYQAKNTSRMNHDYDNQLNLFMDGKHAEWSAKLASNIMSRAF